MTGSRGDLQPEDYLSHAQLGIKYDMVAGTLHAEKDTLVDSASEPADATIGTKVENQDAEALPTEVVPPPPEYVRSIAPKRPRPSSISTIIVASAILAVSTALYALFFATQEDLSSARSTATQAMESLTNTTQTTFVLGYKFAAQMIALAWCSFGLRECSAALIPSRPLGTGASSDLPVTQPPRDSEDEKPDPMDVSFGNNFFDCLDDLGKMRAHAADTARFFTIAGQIQQWQGVIEPEEELLNAIKNLAKIRKRILRNSNGARLEGRNGIDMLRVGSERTDLQLRSGVADEELVKHINSVLSSTNDQLDISSKYMRKTGEDIASAEEISETISDLINKEIGRLKRLSKEQKDNWKFRLEQKVNPGHSSRQHKAKDTEEAVVFLGEVIKAVDKGAFTDISSSLSMQQCASNTRHLNKALEKTFDISNSKIGLPRGIQHIKSNIDHLKVRLNQYDEGFAKDKSRHRK